VSIPGFDAAQDRWDGDDGLPDDFLCTCGCPASEHSDDPDSDTWCNACDQCTGLWEAE
jgi:hypothetical protein